MTGQVSITIGTPAAVVRAKASWSTTPSWNHTARAPIATAWSANSPARSERRKTSTQSTGNGTSASDAKPSSPSTWLASGWIGTIRLPCCWRKRATPYAVRDGSPPRPTTAQVSHFSSMKRRCSGSCQAGACVMPRR